MTKKLSHKDYLQFNKRRFCFEDWRNRVVLYLENNIQYFIPDTEYEKSLDSDDWFMFNGIDTTRTRYVLGTIKLLKKLNNKSSLADKITPEIRAEWCCESLAKIKES